jgi:hypothetical protein
LHVLTNTYLYKKRGREIEKEREAKKEKEIEVKQERKGKQPRYEKERKRVHYVLGGWWSLEDRCVRKLLVFAPSSF